MKLFLTVSKIIPLTTLTVILPVLFETTTYSTVWLTILTLTVTLTVSKIPSVTLTIEVLVVALITINDSLKLEAL